MVEKTLIDDRPTTKDLIYLISQPSLNTFHPFDEVEEFSTGKFLFSGYKLACEDWLSDIPVFARFIYQGC